MTTAVLDRRGLRLGPLLFGLALVPLYVWWTLVIEEVGFRAWPTSVSIFYHCVVGLLALLALNALLLRWLPRLAMSRAELLAIYTLISLGVAVSGHDHQMVYLRGWVYALYKASHDPAWARFADLPWPPYITIHSVEALDNVFRGFSTLYRPEHWRVWLIPIAFLSLFLALIQGFGASLNRLVVMPWIESERLTFPIAQLPLEMTGRDGSFWRHRALWAGFALVAVLDLYNGIHDFIPSVPVLPIKGFPTPRGAFPPAYRPVVPHFVRFFPWMIGLCFLLPTELSLSSWVFFWVLRVELFYCAWRGWPIPFPYQTGAVAPHIVDQGVGAYLVLFAAIVYGQRNHLRHAWRAARGLAGELTEQRGYRMALIGGAVSLLGLYACLRYVGLQWHYTLLALAAYGIMVTVICKVRGEMGPPMYDLHFAGPDRYLALYVGPSNLSRKDWVGVGFLFGFNRGQRNLSLPHMTEGLWLQHETRGSLNRLTAALYVAGVLAALTTCWGLVHLGYEEGFDLMAQAGLQQQGWQRIQPWFEQPGGPNLGALTGVAAGAVVALVLTVLRQQWIGFPLHPGGFLLATNWAAELMWCPMLIAWLIKSFTLRAGGVKAYRQARPFFLGLVLGEFVVGTFWSMVAYIWDVTAYSVTW